MKKIKGIWWFTIWALVTLGLVGALAYYQNIRVSKSDNKTVASNTLINSQNGTASSNEITNIVQKLASANGGSITLDLVEVAKHNSASDCWMVINNKVYDVTAAIIAHPGGSGPIIRHCGQEATQAFDTKDIGRPHSGNASNQLTDYYLGNLNQTFSAQQVANKTSKLSSPVSSGPSAGSLGNSSSSTTPKNIPPVVPPVVPPTGTVTLNMAEIAKHNSASDCWMIISNKVYNVTGAISSHPGGAGPIILHCGQDATQAFATKDIGRPHSSNAASMLTSYYIGDFNQTIGQQTIQQTIQQTNTVVPPTQGRGEDDNGD